MLERTCAKELPGCSRAPWGLHRDHFEASVVRLWKGGVEKVGRQSVEKRLIRNRIGYGNLKKKNKKQQADNIRVEGQ